MFLSSPEKKLSRTKPKVRDPPRSLYSFQPMVGIWGAESQADAHGSLLGVASNSEQRLAVGVHPTYPCLWVNFGQNPFVSTGLAFS